MESPISFVMRDETKFEMLAGVCNMRFLVNSDDGRCKECAREFAVLCEKEYQAEIKKLRYRVIPGMRRLPKEMVFSVVGASGYLHDNPLLQHIRQHSCILAIGINLPDMEMLRRFIAKAAGRDPGHAKWKEKMIEGLSGYLTARNVRFEEVSYIGD
jgi:hypothetical protein